MEKHVVTLILVLSTATFICNIDAQVCGEYGFFCNSCSSIQLCIGSVPTGVGLTCPDGTYCDQSSTAICTAANCTREPYPFYECEAEGSFPWVNNCSEFISCVNNTGTLAPSLNSCPDSTVFNPNTATCVSANSYTCVEGTNDSSTTTTDAVTTTIQTLSTTTEGITTTVESITTTTEPSSTTTSDATTTPTTEPSVTTQATTTIAQAATTTIQPSTTTRQTTSEPTTSPAEPTTPITESISTVQVTTTPSTEAPQSTTQSTATTSVSSTTAAVFFCTTYGRFPVTSDTTCQSYYFCSPNVDGTYAQFLFVCPTTTVFNPITAVCVAPTAYTCTN